MPSDRRIVTRNAAVGWLALLLRAAVSFSLFPLLLSRLGFEVFGIWLIFGDLLGHAALVRLGLSAGLLREVAQLDGAGQRARIVHLLGTVLSIYLLMGTVLGLCLAGFAPWIVALFDPTTAVVEEIVAAMRVVALRMFMTFPASVIGSALLGLRRHDLEYAIQGAGNLLRLALVWHLVEGTQGILVLAWIMVSIDLLENVARRICVHLVAPDLRIRPQRISLRLLGTIRRFSIDAFILNVAVRIQYELDSLVIGLALGLHLVPVYEAAVKVIYAGRQLIDRLTDSLAPTIASLIGRGRGADLGAALVRWSTYLVLFGTPIVLGMFLLGPAFLGLYVGDELSSEELRLACAVLAILALAFASRLVQVIPGTFLWGMARMRRAARCALLEALANLCLSLLLCLPLGILGVALGTLLPKLVSGLWLIPKWAAEAVGIERRKVLSVASAPLRAALISSLATLPVVLWVPGDWLKFLAGGTALVAVYTLVVLRGPSSEIIRPGRETPRSRP